MRFRPLLDRLRAAMPDWAGGALTGVQGVALTYLVILAPALAAVAGAPSLDGSAAVDWGGATSVSSGLWLLGLGVPIEAGGATVSLIPLGLPLAYAAILAGVARRFATKSWAGWGLAVVTFAAGAFLVAALATAATHSTTANAMRAAVGAAVIAAPAVAVGIWRAHGAQLTLLDRIPADIRAGLRLGLGTLAAVVAFAAAVGAVWAVLGVDRIAAIATGLRLDPLGAGVLAVGEALYVPTMVAWLVAWVTGPGFVVGAGTLLGPDTVTVGALPDVPLLGTLPSGAGGWWGLAPAVVVALAFAARIALRGRIGVDLGSARAGGAAVAAVAAGLAALTAASRGSLGPGRLAVAGAEVIPVTVVGTGLAIAGFALAWGALWCLAWLRSRGDDARVGTAAGRGREPVRAG